MPAAQQRPSWRTRTARRGEGRARRSAPPARSRAAGGHRPAGGRRGRPTRRDARARGVPAATIACPSIWLASTTGRRPSLWTPPTKPLAVGSHVEESMRCVASPQVGKGLTVTSAGARRPGVRRPPRPAADGSKVPWPKAGGPPAAGDAQQDGAPVGAGRTACVSRRRTTASSPAPVRRVGRVARAAPGRATKAGDTMSSRGK